MTRGSVWRVSALLPILFLPVLEAQSPALDIKMGLWDIAAISHLGGEMAIDTTRMPPEQKKVIEQAMKKAMSEARTSVAKWCLSQKKLEKWIFAGENPPGQTCTQTPTSNTPTSLEVTTNCTGEHASTAQMHLDALSPTSIKGAIKSTTTEQDRTMTLNVALTGKWLGSDCGSDK